MCELRGRFSVIVAAIVVTGMRQLEKMKRKEEKVLIFGSNFKIGAEKTSTSRTQQILRDPKRFKEVCGYPLHPFQRDVVFLLRVPTRGGLSIARFQWILYKKNQRHLSK